MVEDKRGTCGRNKKSSFREPGGDKGKIKVGDIGKFLKRFAPEEEGITDYANGIWHEFLDMY